MKRSFDEERGFCDYGPRRDDMAIREDEAALGIDDEAGRLRRGVPLRVEGARLVDFDGDDALRDALERAGPAAVGRLDADHRLGGSRRGRRRRCELRMRARCKLQGE